MAKFLDENGNEVTAFTAEELEAAKKAAAEEAVKNYTPPAPAEKPPEAASAQPGAQEVPEHIKQALDRVSKLEAMYNQGRIERLADKYVGSDAAKRAQFVQSFNQLTGYEDSDAGFEQRAAGATKLAFGAVQGIDTQGLGGGAGRDVDANPAPAASSETDKAVQAAFGLSEADVKKYGNN